MPITSTHRYVSRIQDDPDTGLVRPSNWNDTHVVVANIDLAAEVQGILPGTNGGTGVNNGVKTITLGGSLVTSGAFSSTFTMTGVTSVTFPTSGTLATVGGTVSSATGTANQVLVNGGTTAQTGAITLSLPQSIATTSSPTFAAVSTAKLSNLTTNGFVKTSGANGTLSVDTNTYLTSTTGVTTVAGTSNQVLVNGATPALSGAVTLSLPQSIATSSDVQFNSVLLQNQYFTAFNANAGTINKGDVVYYTTSSVGAINVDKAFATAVGTMPACGIATASVASGALGIFQSQGVFTGVDTSLLGLNATAYVSSATAGGIATAIADSFATKQAIGRILSLATNGSILLTFGQGVGAALTYNNNLVDIAANGVTNAKFRQSVGLSVPGRSANSTGNIADIVGTANQVLRVSGTTLGFGNIDLSQSGTVGSTVLGVANGGSGSSSTFTTGSVLFAGASGVYSQDNSNFFWDATNHRLGIGNTAPSYDIHIKKSLPQISIENNAGGGGPYLTLKHSGEASGREYWIGSTGSGNANGIGRLQFFDITGSAERMAFDSSGNFCLFNATSVGSGVGVLSIANCTTVPTVSPSGGYLVYAAGNALKGKGGSGTLTTIGVADPHCPVCDADFSLEWENSIYGGKLTICMKCLTAELGERPYIRWNESPLTH